MGMTHRGMMVTSSGGTGEGSTRMVPWMTRRRLPWPIASVWNFRAASPLPPGPLSDFRRGRPPGGGDNTPQGRRGMQGAGIGVPRLFGGGWVG
jgi:hypothetical protein